MADKYGDLSGHTVLIVEDQPILALNLQIALKEAGAEAVVARGPQEALAWLRQTVFSAAVIDPRHRALVRQFEREGVFVVAKPASRRELLAKLATVVH
jgi:ActR/RegA family two-component response regulator